MELYNQGQSLNTSAVVNGLPTNGTPVYARLFTMMQDGSWKSNDYTYTAASPSKAAMTSPVPSSVLGVPSLTFTWSAGIAAQQYWMWIGTTQGGMELYNQDQSLNTSVFVNGLPQNGASIYVRLFTMMQDGAWQWNDYSYTAATQPAPTVVSTEPPWQKARDNELQGVRQHQNALKQKKDPIQTCVLTAPSGSGK